MRVLARGTTHFLKGDLAQGSILPVKPIKHGRLERTLDHGEALESFARCSRVSVVREVTTEPFAILETIVSELDGQRHFVESAPRGSAVVRPRLRAPKMRAVCAI